MVITFEGHRLLANSTDEELMKEVADGDLRKLAILFERHQRALFNFFRHMNGDPDLSQDLVQDVFFRILRYRKTYAPGKQFVSWMYQIARNASTDQARKRKGEVRTIGDWSRGGDSQLPEPVSAKPGADETLVRSQEVRLLQKALDRLPENKREVLVLSRFQGLSHGQIARILGCEVGAVKVRIFRAVRALGEVYFELSGEKAS